MSEVEVRYYGILQSITKKKSEKIKTDLDDFTLRALIRMLQRKYAGLGKIILDSTGSINPYMLVFINRKAANFIKGLNTKIHSGDVVELLSAVGGG